MNNSNQICSGHVNQNTKANRKSTKSTSSSSSKKKQGVKVVYISNPMKVRTSASEFRALVQELTGQDSELPDPARFSENSSPDSNFISEVQLHSNPTAQIGGDHHHHRHDALDLEVATPTQEQPECSNSNITQYHELYDDDDLFVPEMIDNFGGLLPSGVLYGSY